MTVHRGVLRRGRDDFNFPHRMTNLGDHAEQPGEMRFGSELEDGFAGWLWHLDNGRILTGSRK